MEEVVWFDERDVQDALSRLGLTVELLLQVVRAGYLARLTRTKNDPPNAAGTFQWIEMVRTLREHLVADNWQRSNKEGLPLAIDWVNRIAIAVSSGNSNTGIPNHLPSTKYHKGPGTIDLVTLNAQLMLPFPEEILPPRRHRAGTLATWTLLFFTDEHEIRSELSLATMIDESGQINGWRERIILPALPLDGDGFHQRPEPDFGPDVDIDIRRRA